MWSDLAHRLRAVLRRKTVERELDDELRFHLERQAEKYMKAGSSAEDADRRARLEFGGRDCIKEDYRDSLGVSLLETIVQDLRYGFRAMRRSPAFTLLAVVSLSIGIGANTAVFSVMDTLLFKPLPVRNPDQLVSFLRISSPHDGGGNSFPYGLFELFQERSQSFSGVLASLDSSVTAMKVGDESADGNPVRSERVSSNYFAVLGVKPVLGRIFEEGDALTIGTERPVVISYALWQNRFGGDQFVLGKRITLGRDPLTIVGVAPRGFFGIHVGERPDMWRIAGDVDRTNMLGGGTTMVARLKSGFTLEQARAESVLLHRQIMNDAAAADPQHRNGLLTQRIEVESATTGIAETLRGEFTEPLWILMASVASLFLIVCNNIGGLLLARATARQREIGIRLALGSGRLRLIRQLLTEGAILAAIGATAGLLTATPGIGVLLSYASLRSNARLEAGLDLRVLAFATLTTILSVLIFALVPALRATPRVDLYPNLKQGSRSLTGGTSRLALNNLLVVSQIALSLVLLAGAGLMVRTLHNLRHLDAGFDKRNVLFFSVDRGVGLEPTAADAILFKQMPSKFEAVPGVLSSTLLVNYGLLGGNTASLRINNVEGYVPRADEDMEIAHLSVGPRFFETMGTPLLRGRDFRPDDELSNRRVAVINETMAKYFFGDKDPVGRLVWGQEVIGVAKDAKHRSLREHTPRTLYVGTVRPFYPGPVGAGIRFAVRTSGNPADVTSALRDIVHQFDAGFQLRNIETLNDRAEATLVNERLLVRFAGVFSLIAVLLACIGLYGTLSYAVVQRTSEIGVRMALGARSGDVVKTMMVDTARILGVGLLLGLTGTIAFMRLISSFLFGITPTDPLTLSVAALLLVASAASAAYWPARRASAVDPIIALRHE